MQLKTGDILHCTGARLLARLVMFFTRSKISHTAIVICVWDQLYVIDAQKNGVNPKPLQDWLDYYKYKIKVSRNFSLFNEKNLSIRCFSKVGLTSYDFVSLLFYQPWYLLTERWIGKTKENSTKRMYCSEYVGWCLEIENYWELSPEDIYKLMNNEELNYKTFDYVY